MWTGGAFRISSLEKGGLGLGWKSETPYCIKVFYMVVMPDADRPLKISSIKGTMCIKTDILMFKIII